MPDRSDYEKHFNDLQLKLRAIASSWMLTGFGAIAFLMVNDKVPEDVFNRYNLINLISAMSVMSLFVLWMIDQLAYQRLLNACLVVDLYAEFRDRTRAPVKAMMAYAAGTGMTKYYNWFYFLPMLFFTMFSVIAVYLNMEKMEAGSRYYSHNIGFGLVLVLVSVILWGVALCLRKQVPFVTLARAFTWGTETKDFVDVVNNKEGRLEKLISSYDPGS